METIARSRIFLGISAKWDVYTLDVVEHDYGFAPNPFWGVCTLGFCKPLIRKAVSQGDILIGTGSSADDNIGRLVYWMKVGGIYHFDDYWNDPAFSDEKTCLERK